MRLAHYDYAFHELEHAFKGLSIISPLRKHAYIKEWEEQVKDRSLSLTFIVGRTICARRKFLGISQEALAEKVGIGQQSLSRMEQGKIAPKFERIQLIADALECRVADLFSEVDATDDSDGKYMAEIVRPLSPYNRQFVMEQTARMAKFLARKEVE